MLYYLGLRQATLAVAESCTGGMISERITSVPAVAFVPRRRVVYSDQLKSAFAGVPADLIAKHGAVSAEVAGSMANGIRRRTGATIGVGVTGVAGPSGGTEEKPVGMVYVAVSDAQKTETVDRIFRGDRQRIREWTAQIALDMVRRRLL